jgi:hypothetical protein
MVNLGSLPLILPLLLELLLLLLLLLWLGPQETTLATNNQISKILILQVPLTKTTPAASFSANEKADLVTMLAVLFIPRFI